MRHERHRFLLVWIASLIVACVPTFSQQPQQAPNPQAQTTNEQDFQCPHAADPRRRQRECNDQGFGLDETLAGEWDVVRRAMRHVGITPTASYVGALQTNVSGGPHEIWSYAGLLSIGLSADLGELIKARGLSVYVGAAWGTGSKLAGSLASTIPTSGLYAPSIYLGEMYLQQRLGGGKLTVLAGRLAAGNGFANLPMFNNYVAYGINPNPYSLGANDVTFFGPPPGTEWGAQATYAVSPSLELQGGIFNTNINSANGANHGADFTLQEGNKGVLTIAEADYFTHQRDKAKGKPGQVTIGYLHSSNSFPALNNPLIRSEGYSGVYLMAQQMVYRPGGLGTTEGATDWGAWTYNFKDLVSPVPVFGVAERVTPGSYPRAKTMSFPCR
jgi:hypothetical protein